MFHQLFKAVSMTMGIRVAGIVLQLVWFMLLVRVLPLEQVGIYSAINAGFILLRALGPLGMDMVLLREVPVSEDPKEAAGLLHDSRRYIACTILGLSGMGAVLAYLTGVSTDLLLLCSIICGCLAYSMIGLYAAALLATDKPIAANVPDALCLPAGVILLLLVAMFYGIANVTLLLAGQALIGLLIVLWYRRRVHHTYDRETAATPSQDRTRFRRDGLGLFTNVALNNVSLRLPILLAPFIIGTAGTALLEAATRFATLLGLVHWAACYVLLPKLSQARGKPKEQQQLLNNGCLLIAIPTFVGWLILVATGHWVLELVAGKEYVNATTAMLIIGTGMLVNALSGPLAQLYNLSGHQKDARRVYIRELVALLMLLVFGGHYYGANGMASAVMFALVWRNLELNWRLYGLTQIYPPLFSRGGIRALKEQLR